MRFHHRCVKHMDLLGELRGGRAARTKEAIAVAKRAAHGVWMTATNPERRERLLEGFGLDWCIVELPEASREADTRLGPASLHQLQPFCEPSNEVGRINRECGGHPAAAADANAHLYAPMTELIECANALGKVDWTVQWADDDSAPQP